MQLFLILPILIPLGTAVACLLAWNRVRLQRAVNLAGAASLLAVALGLLHSVWRDGIQAAQIGDWPAPFGITLVADLFSAIMVVVTAVMGLAVALYSVADIDRDRESFGYYSLFHALLMGLSGAFLTGDIFNLYVWFEVMLIASFVLVELGGEKAQLEGAIKYVTLNLISSALFLTAIAILYGMVGTLNMADLAVQLARVRQPVLLRTLAMLFLLAFGIKAALFPLFFWLPASYHTPPAAVSAIFAGLLTKVGVYALIRVFTLLFVHDVGYTHKLILILSGLTMVTGVLGAVAQNEFRRILAFHSVSQIGYMILGLGLFTPLALAGSIFFMIHHSIVKSALFLVSGVTQRLRGSYELKKLGGLYETHPSVSLLFLIPALSLAGMPPFTGFWGKFILARAGLQNGEYLIVATLLGVGLLTLFSMTKIWSEAFWGRAPQHQLSQSIHSHEPLPAGSATSLLLPVVVLVLLMVAIGLFAEPMLVLTERAAGQLANPAQYIQTVLGGAP